MPPPLPMRATSWPASRLSEAATMMTSTPMAAALFLASPSRAVRPLPRAAQAMTAALAAARRSF
ncbi:hypothetical protein D7S70_18940 [Ralstonia pickettii]|nr:hypothetical protein [Ralstonia pickettii]MBB0036553.1 hypothetical protein [Ralstonia pickettii]MBB0099093.1 hypothetical protein [Ralstonia pickettii]MBB0108881.1 hypothetical protein [Ralstonia pickettii]MBB0129867.1 hypothetical protein [Ralstonia pickettii]